MKRPTSNDILKLFTENGSELQEPRWQPSEFVP